jgi:hypothetical protein
MQKARAARRRPPLPWRSGMESRVIEQLVWQWFQSSDKCRVTSDEKRQQQVPHRHPAQTAGWVRDDSPIHGTPQIIARAKERPWSAVRVARLLGVSHTWVNKLVKKFEADGEGMRRKMRAFAPANLEKLERAREETRREREMGRLRGPIRWRRVKVTIQGKKMRMAAPTKEEMRRRARNAVASGVMSETKQQQVPHTAERRPVRNDSAFLPYRELPSWAKGLMVAGDAGVGRTLPLSGQAGGASALPPMGASRRTPRPVPFAFRRRR